MHNNQPIQSRRLYRYGDRIRRVQGVDMVGTVINGGGAVNGVLTVQWDNETTSEIVNALQVRLAPYGVAMAQSWPGIPNKYGHIHFHQVVNIDGTFAR